MKKLVSLMVFIVICFSALSTASYAAIQAPTGIRPEPYEPTGEHLEKLNRQDAYKQEAAAKKDAAVWEYLKDFKCIPQEQAGFGTAACAQSILAYIGNMSYEQSTIARAINNKGSGIEEILKLYSFLCDMQKQIHYTRKHDKNDINVMKYDLYCAVTLFEVPAAVEVNASDDSWLYNIRNHVVCINGARSDWEAFAIADPLMFSMDPTKNTTYKKGAQDVFAVSSADYCRYLY